MFCMSAEHAVEHNTPVAAPSKPWPTRSCWVLCRAKHVCCGEAWRLSWRVLTFLTFLFCRARGACSSSCCGAEPAGGAGHCQAARV